MASDTPSRPSTGHVDTSVPNEARVYDLLLGGKDNFAADRAFYDRLVAVAPQTPRVMRENRKWQGRVLRWLVSRIGVDQFLDLGAGLPTLENTHEVVRRLNHDATVVYVDNDPGVVAFGRALLADDDRTHVVGADLTDVHGVLTDRTVAAYLDLDRPVAMVQGLTLQYVASDEQARQVMAGYIEALPSGSYIALSHFLTPDDRMPDRVAEAAAIWAEAFPAFRPRTREEILALVPGLELIDPGLVPLHEWWPSGPRPRHDTLPDTARSFVGLVGRKP